MDVVAEIESRAYAAWPAATEHHDDGWILRTAGGFSRRLNSVQPGHHIDPLDTRLIRAQDYYHRRDLPLIFRVTPLCPEIESPLEALGFTREATTAVLTLNRLPEGTSGALVTSQPSKAWIEAQHDWLAVTNQSAWESILGRACSGPGETGFGLVIEDGAPAAAGLAVVESGWVGLFEITVAPAQRGRGLGRLMTEDLLRWGSGAGVRRAYLQVMESTVAARNLYDSLGFIDQYSYWYRRAPVFG